MSDGGAALVENLFRQEAGRLVAVLTRILGLHNLPLAEDLVQETLCEALEVWKYGRVPENPAAWLTRCARNRAIDAIRREKVRRKFASDVAMLLDSEWSLVSTVDRLFSEAEIADDQLRMMFACCDDGNASEVQVALILKMLCGFGVAEIAQGFLTSEAAVEKQLSRGKRVLADLGELAEVSGAAVVARLDAVHRALYLLFNEGYHSTQASMAVREDLCREAIRMAMLLAAHPLTGVPKTLALAALFSFHAARLSARVREGDGLVLLREQDRSLWDRRLIGQGFALLDRSSAGDEMSEYHVEAAIASVHCAAERVEDTQWAEILGLYELLYRLRPTPVVALNRAIVIAEVHGAERGLDAIDAIDGAERLSEYPFFHAARAECLRALGRHDDARCALDRAIEVARTDAERHLLTSKRAVSP